VEDGYDLSRDIVGFIEEFKEKGLLTEFL